MGIDIIKKSPSSRRAWIEISQVLEPSNGPKSPSSRRAWIEIRLYGEGIRLTAVALLAEGVDRNTKVAEDVWRYCGSPSSRRAWIEIVFPVSFRRTALSPSSRRAWIEIAQAYAAGRLAHVALLAEGVDRNMGENDTGPWAQTSPSSRRAWIEIRRQHDRE